MMGRLLSHVLSLFRGMPSGGCFRSSMGTDHLWSAVSLADIPNALNLVILYGMQAKNQATLLSPGFSAWIPIGVQQLCPQVW